MTSLYRKNYQIRCSFLILYLFLVSGCSDPVGDLSIDSEKFCQLSINAFSKQDFDKLLKELESQTGVNKNKIIVTERGVFVPMKKRFVEEEGLFVARPGTDINEKGTDPSFKQIKNCLYHYKIKG